MARVTDSVQDLQNSGSADGVPAVLLMVYREPNANIIDTADAVEALLPMLRDMLPPTMNLQVSLERTSTVRASIREVQKTLVISVVLVVLVVLAFLRSWRATLIPAATVPVSLVTTFAFMYLAGFSINNLSLMALIIAAGFVVDDAIVVLENTARHVEEGMAAPAAALARRARSRLDRGVDEPVAGGGVHTDPADGRPGRQAVPRVRADAVGRGADLDGGVAHADADDVRAAARPRGPALRPHGAGAPRDAGSTGPAGACCAAIRAASPWALRHSLLTLLMLVATVGLNVYLFGVIPKGFVPEQDTGKLIGWMRGDQSSSFQLTRQKMQIFVDGVRADPAVQSVTATTGGGSRSTGQMYVQLKPLAERRETAREVVNRLREQFKVPGARLFLTPIQDVRSGGRQSSGSYQYTLRSDDIDQLRRLDAAPGECAAAGAAAHRRRQRPGGARPAGGGGDRPADGGAARHQRRPDRHHARQRLLAVGRLDDLRGRRTSTGW